MKLPAGEFDALKIKRVVFFDYWVLTVRGRSEIVEYEWYAPAVKQAVRREASSQHLTFYDASQVKSFRKSIPSRINTPLIQSSQCLPSLSSAVLHVQREALGHRLVRVVRLTTFYPLARSPA